MKTVIVDVERIKHPASGLGQFCQRLVGEMRRQGAEGLEFYGPSTAQWPLERETKWWHRWWGVPVPENCIWHSTQQLSRFWPTGRNIKIVYTIHDLNFLSEKSQFKARRYLRVVRHRAELASILTTISDYTKRQIVKHLSVAPERIRVVPNGSDPSTLEVRSPEVALRAPFLFALGVMSEKKNFHLLIPMMRHLPEFQLLIAGGPKNSYWNHLQEEVHRAGLTEQVTLLGPVDEPTKNGLYQRAQAVLVPSRLEGFGLPLAEAMRWGRPVVSSRHTALPEVGGDVPFYWDREDPESLARVVREAVQGWSPERSQRAHERGMSFSWRASAEGYIQIYRELQNPP